MKASGKITHFVDLLGLFNQMVLATKAIGLTINIMEMVHKSGQMDPGSKENTLMERSQDQVNSD